VKQLWAAAACFLAFTAPAAAWAQQTSGTIAVFPVLFQKGNARAEHTGKEVLNSLLDSAKTARVPQDQILKAWQDTTGAPWPEKPTHLATREEMLAVGRAVNAEMVMETLVKWHTRTVWVSLGPKVKSDCTVTCLILNSSTGETVFEARDIKMDDTAKEDVVRAVGGAVLSGAIVVPVLTTGGDPTPHQQRAVQLALNKALMPWIKARTASAPRQ
jgi:hypothetical protein